MTTGLLNKAADWLPKALGLAKSVAGGVVLSRGQNARSGVPAIRAWSASRVLADPDGLLVSATPYDYLIAATEYRTADALIEPQPGDRIVEPLGTFEVLQPGDRDACFELREDGLYRIHTKRIGPAT
jgi:hypothetical protein